MLRSKIVLGLLAAALSGCAAGPQIVDADCRHVLTADGMPLRFCEVGNRVTVDAEPPTKPPTAGSRLIDNPEFLAQLIDKMPRNPNPANNVERGPQICTGDAPGYVTIKTGDFIKMVGIHPQPASDRAFSLASGDVGPPPRTE